MGRIFVARDLRYDRLVAVKVLRPELAAAVGARFLQEIDLAAKLTHPHILPLYDSGEAADSLFYVMPFIAEDSLQQRLRRERQLPVSEAVHIAREVADGLAYAHAHGIVHRDIKPGNILLSGGHALIADFGIARAVSAVGGTISSAGLAVGTPAYMSPEQAAADVTVLDGRSDIYSLGCVLYEMLAGTPPFSAATPQAMIARHLTDSVPPVRTVRPIVPEHVERAVNRALAKVAADRYATAAAFKAALARPKRTESRGSALAPGRSRRGLALVVAGVALAAILAVTRLTGHRASSLEADRVVVFPLSGGGDVAQSRSSAEDVTAAMVAALNSTQLLKSVNGWRLASGEQHDSDPVPDDVARRLALRTGAAHYVDGRIITGDSTRAIVTLHDLRGGPTLERTVTLPPTGDAWSIGVATARELVPLILGDGTPVDLSALGSPNTAAAAAYLLGSRAFRRGHFEQASTYFTRAVESDTTFAMAAVMGAEAAGWARDNEKAAMLIEVALRHRRALGPRFTHFVRGLAATWNGQADTAVVQLRQALALDPVWPEAWTELGEVYSHSLPSEPAADSLQSYAFERARALDPGFIPALYHLVEIALRRGRVSDANRLIETMSAAGADSVDMIALRVMLLCVKDTPRAVAWEREVREHAQDVVDVGGALAVAGLRQPQCSEAAWKSLLAYDAGTTEAGLARRHHALSGLHELLVAERRYREAQQLLDSERRLPRTRVWPLQIVAVLAGAPQEEQARAAADSLARLAHEGPGSAMALWSLAVWGHHAGRADEVKALADRAAAGATRLGATDLDTLVAQSLLGWAALAGGDTLRALNVFQTLMPLDGGEPWESLGAERLAVAEIHLRRGHYADAFRVASLLDSPGAATYVIHLRKSLLIRAQAARAMADQKLATDMERRLAVLDARGTQ